MGNYSRLIAYIYEYDGRVQLGNKGFVRVDIRNGCGRLYISVRALRERNGILPLFFYRWSQGIMHSVLIGELKCADGAAEAHIIFKPEQIEPGVTFADISGIVLSKGARLYGAEWDEREINTELLDFNGAAPKTELVAAEAGDTAEEESAADKTDDRKTVPETGESANVQGADNWRRIFTESNILQPFDDDMMYDCVETKPELMQYSPFSAQNFGQNSFLLHGFYSYGHLLVGKMARPGKNKRYFVGVPGIYNNRERVIASMYGFDNFRKSIRRDYKNPHFGYWYCVVDDN